METGMGDVVNLRRLKKRAEKHQSARQADANRAKFGRSKSDRLLEQQRADRAKDLLDQHRRDDGEAS
jgi:preprotein translocase subunit SecA